MTSPRLVAALAAAVLLLTMAPAVAGTSDDPEAAFDDDLAAQVEEAKAAGGDAVVVAVIDNAISPYHWDFVGSQMPQHLDGDPATDLPLDQAPDTWLPGFADPGEFNRYEALPLTLSQDDPNMAIRNLDRQDDQAWAQVERSSRTEVNYYWVPDSKVIGLLDFSGNRARASDTQGSLSHGTGSASVSVGNLHGTCPECLLVFLTHGGGDREAAIDWAMSQPWIDVITNSYGYSLVMRDRLYSGSSTDLQREASERGQTIWFSAGNGQANTFTVPNTTYFSSQEGPDWIITVGAVSPEHGAQYTGAGKPANIAAPGLSYPAAGGPTVTGQSNFSGTSNATPTAAGMYSRALHRARAALGGEARVQSDGVIARGEPVACGDERPDCELGDGELTANELRTRLFHGTIPPPHGPAPTLVGDLPTPSVDEYDFMASGYGVYFGRLYGSEHWAEEEDRLFGPMVGAHPELERRDGEDEWMTVDSYCRQSIWGTWSGGAWAEGEGLPGPDPLFPLRSALEATCGELFPPVS